MRIFLWEGHILALFGGQSKMQQPWGISGCLGAVVGAPIAWECNMPIFDLDEVGEKKKKDILMVGSHT